VKKEEKLFRVYDEGRFNPYRPEGERCDLSLKETEGRKKGGCGADCYSAESRAKRRRRSRLHGKKITFDQPRTEAIGKKKKRWKKGQNEVFEAAACSRRGAGAYRPSPRVGGTGEISPAREGGKGGLENRKKTGGAVTSIAREKEGASPNLTCSTREGASNDELASFAGGRIRKAAKKKQTRRDVHYGESVKRVSQIHH